MTQPPEVLLFDLFGTLVFFDDSRIPQMEVQGRRFPSTVRDLPGLLSREAPGVTLARFVEELGRAGREIQERRRAEGIEVHTSVRFIRALRGVGLGHHDSERLGRGMAESHMDSLARAVVSPPGRRGLLDSLATRFRLGLLSNFDDGPTARRVLAEAGLEDRFEVVLVSADEGLRKPNRALFSRACERLGVPASRTLYIGDTWEEDVLGASGAGLGALWVRRRAADAEPQDPPPSPALGAIEDVEELPEWLEASGFSARGAASR